MKNERELRLFMKKNEGTTYIHSFDALACIDEQLFSHVRKCKDMIFMYGTLSSKSLSNDKNGYSFQLILRGRDCKKVQLCIRFLYLPSPATLVPNKEKAISCSMVRAQLDDYYGRTYKKKIESCHKSVPGAAEVSQQLLSPGATRKGALYFIALLY